jgi:hypothetical protein
MEAVWGAVLAFLFVLATLSGYGAGTPQIDNSSKDKSDQSDKKDESDKSKDSSSKDKSDKKGKSGQKDKSGPKDKGSKEPKTKAEFCIKDCPEAWRIRS